MQPLSDVKLDEKSFAILKRTIKNISIAKRGKKLNCAYAMKLPAMVGLKITNKCNLRCRHCYEWSADGYHREMHHSMQNAEMHFDILRRIIDETREVNSSLYVWGGEPLLYSHFDKFADLIENDKRIVALCTNGVFIEDKIGSILKIGPNIEVVIAIEGFEEENDFIRGNGAYSKAINAVNTLSELKRKRIFVGKITVHTVINEMNYNKLYDFVRHMEQYEIDSLLLCFPWYISEESAIKMDTYYKKSFSRLKHINQVGKCSWHSFKYGLAPSCSVQIISELDRIINTVWKIRVRYFPELKYDEVFDFLQGKHVLAQNRVKCNAVSTRMDVLADGSVSSCKHFPEFVIGNLAYSSVYDLWNSEKFARVREIVDKELMPVCSQCNNLYLHGE